MLQFRLKHRNFAKYLKNKKIQYNYGITMWYRWTS